MRIAKIKPTLLAFALLMSMGAFGAAQADTTILDPGAGSYTFEGQNVNLSVFGFINADCDVSLTGDVSKNPDGSVTISVTDGAVTAGDALCNGIGVEFTPPWTTTVAQADLPPNSSPNQAVHATFDNVDVTYGPHCNGGPSSIDATFRNGPTSSSDSSFSFDDNIGECAIDGQLFSDNDIDVTVVP